MPRFKIQVTEINAHPDGVTPAIETEVFKLVVDTFDPVAFTKAITAQPRRRRKAKTQE